MGAAPNPGAAEAPWPAGPNVAGALSRRGLTAVLQPAPRLAGAGPGRYPPPMWFLLLACGKADRADLDAGPSHDDTAPALDSGPLDPCVELGATDPCCRPPAEVLWACAEGLEGPGPHRGVFLSQERQGSILVAAFQSTDGRAGAVRFHGEGSADLFDALPDLPALGEVSLLDAGGCGSDGEGSSGGVLSVYDLAGGLLLAVGASNTGEAGPVTVSWDEGDDTCPDRPDGGCFVAVRNHAVRFLDGEASARLFQGEEADLGGLHVWLRMAMRPASESHCDDVGGNMANWLIVAP